MGKKTSKGGGGGGGKKGGDSDVCWSSDHHAIRKAKQRHKGASLEKQEERERRSALLTRDSKQKREEGKNRLHIKRTQRQLEKLRERLEKWDDLEEELLVKRKEEEELRIRKEQEGLEPKKKKKKGPESWKLKGAARPAHMVYDFDTRYVCPHIKAHEDAKIKATRSRNVLILCKDKFGIESDKNVPQPHCREYLSLLMQLGNLSMNSKQMKSARKCFLECMELDSTENPITSARCQLMRLYMEANRPESARRLWENLPSTDPAVWIRYSAVLIEFVSFKILEEEGSSEQKIEDRMVEAINSNIFCAYYLAFFDNFSEVMDYVEEIEDANETSPLEEAIEYCNSEQLGAWKGTDGAMEWVRNFMVRILNKKSTFSEHNLSVSDLDWRKALLKTRETHAANAELEEQSDDDDNNEEDAEDESNDDDESVVDVDMYATMFETAMEMLEASGALKGKV